MKRRDVQERIDEILSHAAQSTADTVSFDQTRVLNRLDALSRKAEELGQISAAARCEELIGKARGMFVDRPGSFVWDGDLSKLSDEQVVQLQRVMEKRTYGEDQKALEAAKLRFALAAGIQVIDLE
jgi:hypothetical protein